MAGFPVWENPRGDQVLIGSDYLDFVSVSGDETVIEGIPTSAYAELENWLTANGWKFAFTYYIGEDS